MLDRVRADIRADPRSIGARKPDLFDPPSYRLRAEELCRAGLLGEALEMLGEYAEMLGKNAMPTSAAETFALMSSIAPDSKELALRAAAALLDVRKLDLALESAQRARRHDPADPRALHLLADIYTAKGDTKRAAAVRAQLV